MYAPVAHWVWGTGGWLAPARRTRLRGWHGRSHHMAGSETCASRPSGSSATTAQPGAPSCRTPFRSHCSALLSGSAGSVSTAAAPGGKCAGRARLRTNTLLAPSGALVTWTLLDLFRTGRATAVGVAHPPSSWGCSSHHARRRLRQPALGDCDWCYCRRAQLLCAPLAGPDASGRCAGCGCGARARRHHGSTVTGTAGTACAGRWCGFRQASEFWICGGVCGRRDSAILKRSGLSARWEPSRPRAPHRGRGDWVDV